MWDVSKWREQLSDRHSSRARENVSRKSVQYAISGVDCCVQREWVRWQVHQWPVDPLTIYHLIGQYRLKISNIGQSTNRLG